MVFEEQRAACSSRQYSFEGLDATMRLSRRAFLKRGLGPRRGRVWLVGCDATLSLVTAGSAPRAWFVTCHLGTSQDRYLPLELLIMRGSHCEPCWRSSSRSRSPSATYTATPTALHLGKHAPDPTGNRVPLPMPILCCFQELAKVKGAWGLGDGRRGKGSG